MRNLNFDTDVDNDYVKLFFNKLNIRFDISLDENDDRFITYNMILDVLISENKTTIINTLKLKLISKMDINLIFMSMIDSEPELLSIFSNDIEFYFDSDLIKSYR